MNWLERKVVAHYMLPNLRKFWATYGALLAGLMTFLMPSLQAYISANPKSTAAFLLGLVIVTFHSSAPKDQATSPQ